MIHGVWVIVVVVGYALAGIGVIVYHRIKVRKGS